MGLTLIVTRPEPQAAAWVQRLHEAGLDAQALPLLRIAAVDDPSALRQAWRALAQIDLLVFVSPNAVLHFFAQRGSAEWPASTLAAAPGPGSAEALVAAGVAPALVVQPVAEAAQFDSEALWQQLRGRAWAGKRVLVVRGGGGRDWLADTLREAGAQVDFMQAYARTAPLPDATQQAVLQAAIDGPEAHLWLFSSAEAIGHLAALAPGVDWSRASALASHPRIVARARALGVGRVQEVAPTFEAVADAARRLAGP